MFASLRAFLVFLLFSACCLTAQAASDWKIVKIGGREYLTADNIAKFYGLPTGVAPIEKHLVLANANGSVDFQLDSREVMINGVRNWLCFPVTEKDGEYLVSRVDLAKTLEPQLRPQMIPNLGHLKTVVLDPGHGGYDKGAISPYGCEKDFALDVARDIKPLLEAKGLKVNMTRDSDIFVPLELRARIANAAKDAVFVSIHFNATDANPSAQGFEIFSFTPRGAPSTADDALALRFMNQDAGSSVDAPEPRALDERVSLRGRPLLGVRSRDQAGALRRPAPDENPRDPRRGRIPHGARREPADRAKRLARASRAVDRDRHRELQGPRRQQDEPMMVADYRREFERPARVERRDSTGQTRVFTRVRRHSDEQLAAASFIGRPRQRPVALRRIGCIDRLSARLLRLAYLTPTKGVPMKKLLSCTMIALLTTIADFHRLAGQGRDNAKGECRLAGL